MSTINYKETVNLPVNNFPMKASLAQREPERLKWWNEKNLYSDIRTRCVSKPKFILHDGPPYANGNIHIGHALNKILKDIIVKYKTMCGFDTKYVPGWDCHGLPIEHALLKEMGVKDKSEVDQFKFRKKARKYAEKYIGIQREDFKRLGIFGEWGNPYLTMNPEYQAAIVDAFAKLYEAGYIYKGEKPIHWCPECETALAEAELEYNDKTSDSVFVRFTVRPEQSSCTSTKALDLLKQKKCQFLIWTTTPWTLPANVAIAVHPQFNYGFYEAGDAIVVCVRELRDVIASKTGLAIGKEVLSVPGADLAGIVCQHPFLPRESKVVCADYVSREDGTGCVHIAPGHGAEDYIVGLEYKLPVLSPVNEKGQFTDDFAPAAGQKVLKSNGIVIDILKNSGDLLLTEKVQHSYPHCWRCKSPIIFRATKQWFMSVDHNGLREKLKDVITDPKKSEWIPEWGKNRILGMIEDRPDWCLSRQRFWGVPIPVFYCEKCSKEHFTPAIAKTIIDIYKKESADAWFSRPVSDFIPAGMTCSSCKNDTFRKETDILDVWFDSGVSHHAVLKNDAGLEHPASLYLEGSDQHRGWFQTSLITSVALNGISPFKQVLTHGFTVDAQGKKMSKSLGNVVVPQDVIKTFGADILRLWVSSCDYSQDVRISNDILTQMADAYRKIRNTFKYLLGNLDDFDPEKDAVAFDKLDGVDVWALGECRQLVSEVTKAYNEYRFHYIYRLVYNFCVREMSSFYLDVLKDRLYTSKKTGHLRRSSQTVMYYILKNLTIVMAPVLPFTCEEVWQTKVLEKGITSVHTATWPVHDVRTINETVVGEWRKLFALKEFVNALIEKEREKGNVGGSLEAQVIIDVKDQAYGAFLAQFKDRLEFVFIVSRVTLGAVAGTAATTTASYRESEDAAPICEIGVGKAVGTKCERCWMISDKIGSHPVHATICPKCIDALSQ